MVLLGIAAAAIQPFVLKRPNVERMPTTKGGVVAPMPTLKHALSIPRPLPLPARAIRERKG